LRTKERREKFRRELFLTSHLNINEQTEESKQLTKHKLNGCTIGITSGSTIRSAKPTIKPSTEGSKPDMKYVSMGCTE